MLTCPMCRRCSSDCVSVMPLAVLSGTSRFPNSEVPEDGLTHFHILFLIPKHEGDDHNDCLNLEAVMQREVLSEWKRNYGSRKYPDYRPLCTYVRKFIRGRLRTNFDLHYVNPIMSDGGTADVCFYVLKYMMKPSNRAVRLQQALRMNLPEDEYEDLWSIVRPRHFESEALGLGQCVKTRLPHRYRYEVAKPVLEHLRRGIELSKVADPGKDLMPSYFSPEDGHSSPLAKYYKGNGDIFTMTDYLDFFYLSNRPADNIIVKDDVHVSQLVKKVDDFDKKVSGVTFQQSANELDDLYEDFTDSTFIDLCDD